MLGQFVIAYIDNILIYSPNPKTHLILINEVLESLLINHFYVKAEKCEYHASKVKFLSYIIRSHGVARDEEKNSLQ